MKKLLILISLAFVLVIPNSFAITASLDSLNFYIARQSEYNQQKEYRILAIKEKITLNKKDNQKLYSLYVEMFEEYRSYIYDSAYVCVEKLINISKTLNDSDKIISSQVKLGFCYLSSGLFKEAFDVLTSIDVHKCKSVACS